MFAGWGGGGGGGGGGGMSNHLDKKSPMKMAYNSMSSVERQCKKERKFILFAIENG